MEPLRIDPDIRFAQMAPAALFTDQGLRRAVAERVLARAWHVVARAEDVAAKETALPLVLLPNELDEPLLLARDRKERLHCVANVCTHRGGRVCDAAGPAKMLVCPHHGRQFRLDGDFMAAPGFDDALGLPSPSDSLPQSAVAAWGPLVFASLQPDMPFASLVAGALDGVPALPAAPAGPVEVRRAAAQWAVVVGELLDALPQDALQLTGSGASSRGDVLRAWLFPATFVDLTPDAMTVRAIRPCGAAATDVVCERFVAAEGAAPLLPDDAAALRAAESIQSGLASRSRRPARYAPKRERALHHFHRLLASRLA
ncbi:MAG: Carnitine monooxygenase oxygenase subunit [Planctomycetes bacterium]|nr:Carnitine monooxygenase oxygenase subunit [Planctomycetota bacterium]